MRVYFEKPRTTVGWKGLINDPDLDDSFHIEKGILLARELLLYVAELGLAGGHRGARSDHAAVSVRAHHLDGDRRAHHRIADAPRDGERLVDARRLQERHGRRARHLDQRAAVGAASAPFSGHHAAGPVGGVSHARQSARPHRAARRRRARQLRCGEHRAGGAAAARRRICRPNIVVDCSHGNSNKDPSVQPLVAENCVTQILDGNRSIVGLMLESHLKAGNQPIPKDLGTLEYGVSITDPVHRLAEHGGAAAEAARSRCKPCGAERAGPCAARASRPKLSSSRRRECPPRRAAARGGVAVDQHARSARRMWGDPRALLP